MYKKFSLILIIIFLSSCSSKKNILMMQDISTTNPLDVSFSDYKINVDDILKIDVSIESVELSRVIPSLNLK